MTPKEKAKEIINKYWGKHCAVDDEMEYTICIHLAKECALICVDELIEYSWFTSIDLMSEPYCYSQKEFWEEVKTEIEKL